MQLPNSDGHGSGVTARALSGGVWTCHVPERPYTGKVPGDSGPVKRIGVFGGTFDPPHAGHVIAAAEARFRLDLDHLLFVVANDPWQKSPHREVTPAGHRLEMVEEALAGTDRLTASDIEIRRGGPSYSVETLEALGGHGTELFLVLGWDAAAAIETWHQPEKIRTLAKPVVFQRPRESEPLPGGWDWITVPVPQIDVSSSDIRQRVRAGEPVDGMVKHEVLTVIRRLRLYRGAP